jgi:hypothetical protein
MVDGMSVATAIRANTRTCKGLVRSDAPATSSHKAPSVCDTNVRPIVAQNYESIRIKRIRTHDAHVHAGWFQATILQFRVLDALWVWLDELDQLSERTRRVYDAKRVVIFKA